MNIDSDAKSTIMKLTEAKLEIFAANKCLKYELLEEIC